MERVFEENRIKGKSSNVYGELLLCALASLLPLILCSKSSPIYPFNDWYDVNVFLTMGKGLVRGKVLYVDLLDHKGPYIYALAGIAYLLSNDSFHGYFFFECLSMFFFLYYTRKTICLYAKTCPWWILPLLSGAIVSTKSFVHGGSLEELSLGILTYSIYSILCFLRQENRGRMPLSVLFWNGIWAGIIFWSKFTLSGLYLAWISVVLVMCLCNRKGKDFLVSAGVFLTAMSATAVPWLIYFGWHHAIGDWLRVYIWINIFGYASGGENSLISNLLLAVLNTLRFLTDRGNLSYTVPLVLGCVGFVCLPRKKVSLKEKLSVVWMGFVLALGLFVGGAKQDYYGLPLAVFVMFAGVIFSAFWDLLTEKWKRLQGRLCTAALYLAAFAVASAGAFLLSPNTYMISLDREEMPQYRFAEQIKASEDSTVLNYGFLDGGFYTVLDQVPSVPVFCLTNLSPGQQMEQQNTYVEQQLTHWVVAWRSLPVSKEELETLPVVSEYYELADYQYYYFEDNMYTYALYEVRRE